jgi:lipopolysaccharide transport system ATP-binding protein
MQEVGATGQTVLFVSHDLTAISRLAPRTIVMRDGQVQFHGETQEALRLYAGEQHQDAVDLRTRTDREGDGLIRIDSLRFFNASGAPVSSIGSGEAVTIAVGYSSTLANLHHDHLAVDMRFTDILGHPITTFSTRFSTLVCDVPSLALAEETYSVDLWCAYKGGCADNLTRAGQLRVVAAPFFDSGQEPVKRKHGAALIRHGWSLGQRQHSLVAGS